MSYPTDIWRLAAWVMYDMTVNRQSRKEAFARLRKLGFSRRDAAEEIQSYEKEPS